jgi:hypothetical protein
VPPAALGAARPDTRRRWSDGQLIAFFAAAAFVALAFAAGLVVGHEVLADVAIQIERTMG